MFRLKPKAIGMMVASNIEPTTNDDVVSDRRFVLYDSFRSPVIARFHLGST
jgi:hypothetical protein